jgi:hypothetical protein
MVVLGKTTMAGLHAPVNFDVVGVLQPGWCWLLHLATLLLRELP